MMFTFEHRRVRAFVRVRDAMEASCRQAATGHFRKEKVRRVTRIQPTAMGWLLQGFQE